MNMPDLTPTQFTRRIETQSAVRFWLIPLALCALLALVPIVIEHMQPADTHGQIAEERVVQAQSRLDSTKTQITSKQILITQLQRELQAEQHLTERPDWNGVLTLVSQQFNGQLMMVGCKLGHATDPGIRSSLGEFRNDVTEDSVWLMLVGVAETNSDVPGLIMRLETLGLFERVVMTASQREAFAGGSRTIFTLACKVQ